MKTRTTKTPIHTETHKAWADSIIKKGQAAVAHGLGATYTLDSFLNETILDDMPDDVDEYHYVVCEIAQHPSFHTLEEAFKNRFGRVFCKDLVAFHGL